MNINFPCLNLCKCETLHDLDIIHVLLISAPFEQDYTNIAVVINKIHRLMNILLKISVEHL